MKRINLEFGNGYDDILVMLDPEDGEHTFQSYETECDSIHMRFGGRQYYTSKTGLTGAGYITPEADDGLIIFGCYNPKNSNQQLRVVSEQAGNQIFGYAPIGYHSGILPNYPWVLSDGLRVAFVLKQDVISTICKWGSLKSTQPEGGWPVLTCKEIQIPYFEPGKEDCIKYAELYNPDHFKGINILRFLDFRDHRRSIEDIRTDGSLMGNQLHIYEHEGVWYHKNRYGIFDTMWTENPRFIKGEIVDEWVSTGDGLFWRQDGLKVTAFMEVDKNKFFTIAAPPVEEYIDYELEVEKIQWFSKPISEWKKLFLKKCEIKSTHLYLKQRKYRPLECKDILMAHKNDYFTLEDSIVTGNCKLGTDSFLQRYGLWLMESGTIAISRILNSEQLEQMLANFDFQKVIYNKFGIPSKEFVPPEELITRRVPDELDLPDEDDRFGPVVEKSLAI